MIKYVTFNSSSKRLMLKFDNEKCLELLSYWNITWKQNKSAVLGKIVSIYLNLESNDEYKFNDVNSQNMIVNALAVNAFEF